MFNITNRTRPFNVVSLTDLNPNNLLRVTPREDDTFLIEREGFDDLSLVCPINETRFILASPTLFKFVPQMDPHMVNSYMGFIDHANETQMKNATVDVAYISADGKTKSFFVFSLDSNVTFQQFIIEHEMNNPDFGIWAEID